MEKIGRYEIETKFDRNDGPVEYYDVLMHKEGQLIKTMKGCLGKKSCEYWKNYVIKIASRLEILYTRKDMAYHNLLCYSSNYAMTEPKEGYSKEWQESKAEAEVIEAWIKEIESDFFGCVYRN